MKTSRPILDRVYRWRARQTASWGTSPGGRLSPLQKLVRLVRCLQRGCRQLPHEVRHWQHCMSTASPGQPVSAQQRRITTTRQTHNRILWLAAIAALTAVMSHPYLNQPLYDVGTVAPRDIRAPYDATVVDTKTTESLQSDARKGVTPVLKVNTEANRQITDELDRLLDRGEELRKLAGPVPFVESSTISTAVQTYLRGVSAQTWSDILDRVLSGSDIQSDQPSTVVGQRYAAAVRELQVYRQRNLAGFGPLVDRVLAARKRYATALEETLPLDRDRQLLSLYPSLLFELSDEQWQATRTGSRRALERLLLHGIAPGVSDGLLTRAIQLHVDLLVPAAGRPIATELLQKAVQRPNLEIDPIQTRERAEKAAEDVAPVLVSRQKDEMVVRSGEKILPGQLALLDRYQLSRRGVNWSGLLRLAGMVTVALALFWAIERRLHRGLRRRDHILLLLLAASTPLLSTLSTPLSVGLGGAAINLPAVGLLAGSFYGSVVGTILVALMTAVLPFGTAVEWNFLLANGAGGLLAALLAGRLRSREEMAFLGLGVGLTQGAVYLLVNLIDSAAAGSVWSAVLGAAVVYGVAGLAWCVIALGLSPYLEHLFDLVTPIRLAELSNPNRPLLKRLAAEAPGTFQHTLFVASLAESAARALGCNVELVRAGTLYHDIGKLHDPQGFIENQMGGPNKHDEIDDPWHSAAIIKRHVSEGMAMARRYRLPKAIQAFIPEHQGTMAIAYFYHQAKQRESAALPVPAPPAAQPALAATADATNPTGNATTIPVKPSPSSLADARRGTPPPRRVREEDFRYPGPIPQSRETGIVMLADSCEAALRSLKDATYDEALSMVTKILRARWRDEQLVDAGLSRADLTAISEIFVRVWQQVNHQRIAYPKAVLGN